MPGERAPKFERLEKAEVCAALRRADLNLPPESISIEKRDDRWAVTLPGDRMAWFPASEQARERLDGERRVLRLMAERCTFQAPRILYEDASGFDVRALVAGYCDPWLLFARVKQEPELARRIGRAIGTILAEQHTRVCHEDVKGYLPERPSWPEPSVSIIARVAEVGGDAALTASIGHALGAYESLAIDSADRVLVHTDVGLHNIALDPQTDAVRGMFDYDSAAWADRHHDFRYLVFLFEHEHMLEAALAVYEPAVGRTLSRERIALYNAVCAANFLAMRRGVPADRKWAGRTLAEDLEWTRGALARLAASVR